MEEKVIIKSEQYNVKKLLKTLLIVGAVLSLLMFISCMGSNFDYYDSCYEDYLEHEEDGDCGWLYESWETCYRCEKIKAHPTKLGFAIALTFEWGISFLIPVAAFALIGGLIYLWLRSYELTITDKRIYGKVAWGKRVDLPVDSVSATATINHLKGVSVSTASGRISFLVIKNADAIYKVISNLLIERQQEKAKSVAVASIPKSDSADELKKFKELLDMGVITQEEFDAKKKQLLGL